MVDLRSNPYYLDEEGCKWVEDTISGMTDEEKVGQLFFQLTQSQEEDYLKELMEKYHLGGCRYNGAPGKTIQEQNRTLQKYAKIPIIIACNTEAGGDGACADGTPIGSEVKIAATDNEEYAYALGKMANEEAAAIGCNMAFAPVCDIVFNWENSEIINRAFGNDPERVAKMSAAYLRGAFLGSGFISDPKSDFHFEITVENAELAEGIRHLMTEKGITAKIMHRRNSYMIYLKNGDAILEFLAFTEAHRSALALEEARVVKSVRNDVNRMINAELANEQKATKAALEQLLVIRKVLENYDFNALPAALQDFMRLRIANPDVSLKELGERAEPKLSKSAINHRLRRLEALAKELG